MTLLLLEALGAMLLLVLIVWWTMFSGRQGGEPPDQAQNHASDPISTHPSVTQKIATDDALIIPEHKKL